MKDFEQLYYDSLYEIKQLNSEIEILKKQLEIYKSISKDKDIKSIIVKDLSKYLVKSEVE